MKSKFVLFLTLAAVAFVSVGGISKGSAKEKTDTVTLSANNTIVLSSEVDGDSVGKVVYQAKQLDSKLNKFGKKLGISQDPIYLFLNTPGGSIQSGIELIEALGGLGRPINTVTMFSASMGFQIVQALGERLILKNGVLMSHRASGQISGSFGGLKPSQMDNRYSLWYSRMQEFDEQTVKRTNGKQTLDSYQKSYSDELWLTGTQSVAGGYADKVVAVKCDATLDGVTTHSVDFLGLKIMYDLDNCPLNTSPMNIRVASPDQGSTLSYEKVEDTKARFMEQYTAKSRAIVPFRW